MRQGSPAMPSQRKSPARRIAQIIGLVLAALLVVLLLIAGGLALWGPRLGLKPVVERAASESLERRVTLGSLAVRWGNPLGVEISDLAIANAPWGSKPEMVRIGHISALLDLGSLLQGVLRYERLRIADAAILLERDAEGVGNWKFGRGAGGFQLVPRNRTEFPTLVDFTGDRGLVTYRTRGGNALRIRLDRVAIFSASEETPARLLAEGAYGDVPARLNASTDSYLTLRDASEPFGARITLRAPHTDMAFNGRLWEPLDFEGVRGELSIEARALDDILGVMNAGIRADLPLSVAGILRRDGDEWSLAAAKGQVKRSDFSGGLALREDEPGASDDIDLYLDFSTLDLDDIASSFGGDRRPAGLAAMPLWPGGLAGVDVTAGLTALHVRLAGREWHATRLRGRLQSGEATVKELSLALGGGTLSMAGMLAEGGDGGRLSLQARLSKADATEVAREFGAPAEQIRGRLDARADLSMTGPTVGAALRQSEGAAVMTVRDGEIARGLIERLSTDLRSLFRSQEGTVPVSCLLGVVTVRNGLGILSPLRLESREAIAIGAGKIDLVNGKLDLTLKTERDSTNFFALDIPVRISGAFDRLSATPLVGSDEDWMKQAIVGDLPPELHDMAAGSRCAE